MLTMHTNALIKLRLKKITNITFEKCSDTTKSQSKCSTDMCFWNSTEAHRLFHVSPDENVYEVLQRRVQMLKNVNKNPLGYKEIVTGNDIDEMPCNINDIFLLRQKSSYLCLAYTYALKYMNKLQWVQGCCQKASTYLLIIVYSKATNPQTLAVEALRLWSSLRLDLALRHCAIPELQKWRLNTLHLLPWWELIPYDPDMLLQRRF